MAGNYEKGMYNQLLEVMAQLNAVESDLRTEKIKHKDDVDCGVQHFSISETS